MSLMFVFHTAIISTLVDPGHFWWGRAHQGFKVTLS